MKRLIADFTKQVMHAMEITERVKLLDEPERIMNVVISGAGESEIAANMALDAVAPEAKIPVVINKDCFLPNFVSENTLVIISSYSGETEDEIAALREALQKGAQVVCISFGGKIEQLAHHAGIDLILIPEGLPLNVAAVFLFIEMLYIFNFYGILSDLYLRDLTRAIELINAEEDNMMQDAKKTASELAGKYIIINSPSGMESVALRFRRQLNQNPKCFCSQHIFPELFHHEMEGWQGYKNEPAAVIFRNDDDHVGSGEQLDSTEEILNRFDENVKVVYSKGSSVIERMLYLFHWADWVSYFLTVQKGIEAYPPQTPKGALSDRATKQLRNDFKAPLAVWGGQQKEIDINSAR